MTTEVITLFLALFMADGSTRLEPRVVKSVQECKDLEDDVRRMALTLPNVVDAGTLCVKSAFSEKNRLRS